MTRISEIEPDQDTPTHRSDLWFTPTWAFMAKWPRRAVPSTLADFDVAAHALSLGYTSARNLEPWDPADEDGILQQKLAARAVHYGLRADISPAAPLHVGKVILAGRLGAEWVRETIAAESDQTLCQLLNEMINAVWNKGGALVGSPSPAVVRTSMALYRHTKALGYDHDRMIGPLLTEMRLYSSAPNALGAHGRVARALTRPGVARHHLRYDEQHILGQALTNLLTAAASADTVDTQSNEDEGPVQEA